MGIKTKRRGKDGRVRRYLAMEQRYPYPNAQQLAAMRALWAEMGARERARATALYLAKHPHADQPKIPEVQSNGNQDRQHRT